MLITLTRKLFVRICSVCKTEEIDKNTAYTTSGEQKSQGRRCIKCVDSSNSGKKTAPKPPVKKPAVAAASIKPSSVPERPSSTEPQHEPSSNGDSEGSMIKYVLAAVIVLAIIYVFFK